MEYPAEFEKLWKLYPRKVGKALALKSWNKINPSEALQEKISTHVCGRLTGEWKGRDIQHIPHLSTFLNQGRWQDEGVTSEKPATVSFRDSKHPAVFAERNRVLEEGVKADPDRVRELLAELGNSLRTSEPSKAEIERAAGPFECQHEWRRGFFCGAWRCEKCGCYHHTFTDKFAMNPRVIYR